MDGERTGSRTVRILRSAVLAGAGAAVWLALSAGAATADAGTGPDHSPSSTTSPVSVASVLQGATENAGRTLALGSLGGLAPSTPTASAPVPGETGPAPVTAPSPVVQPPAAPVTEAVDQLAATVPYVGTTVPEGTVSTVTSPGTGSIGDVAQGAVNSVREALAPALDTVAQPIVSEALQPVVDAVIPPVVDVVVPVVDAVLPPVPDVVEAALDGIGGRLGSGTDAVASTDNDAGTADWPPTAANPGVLPLASTGGPGQSSGAPLPTGSVPAEASPSGTVGPDREPPLAWPPALAAGSIQASTDFPGASAAWLQAGGVYPPAPWVLNGPPADSRLPLPVSFDPGSSPD